MHLKSKYRLIIMFLILLLLVIFFLIHKYKPRDYKKSYQVGKFSVIESFIKDSKKYSITIKGKYNYQYNINSPFLNKYHLVDKISEKGNCIKFTFNKENYSICKDDKLYYVPYLKKNFSANKIDKYNNIEIYDYSNNKFYIWNYNGFIVLNDDLKQELKLFNSDFYNLDYIIPFDKYLLIADYNEKYKFSNFYLVDVSKNKYKTLELETHLSFDGYILGEYKKYIYFYDLEKEQEYKYNPFTNELKKFSNQILINGNWEQISKHKLQKKSYYFSNDATFKYILIDHKLYYSNDDINILIYDGYVDDIISQNAENVYFICKDTIYYNDLKKGTKKIMKNKEWQFNYKNIYIFNN